MTNDNVAVHLFNLLNKVVRGQIEDYTINFDGNGEKGGNFLGDILFITLKNKKNDKDVHLVVKQAFSSLDNIPVFKGIYKLEIYFYRTLWKTLDDFQKQYEIGFDKIPKYLASDSTEGSEKIALENLRYQGFVLHNKSNPLTKEHLELIMKSYGTFHSISFAYRELHPEEYARLVEPCKNVSFSKMSFYFKHEFENLVQVMENHIDDNILEKMKIYVTEGGKMFEDCLNYTGDTPLLVQGDCWSNNMMFKSDDRGNIEDMKFLDFQYIKSGSPAYDLSYSIYSGVSKDILDRLDFYLKMYHDSFSVTLKKFGCDAQKSYPFEKLKEEWKKYARFGFLMSLPVWRMKYANESDLLDIKDGNDFQEGNELSKGISKVAEDKVELHRMRITDLMTHMFDNGYL